MTETPWTDDAIDAALHEWLPGLAEDVHGAPALRGALHLALDARSTAAALETWDRIAAQHAEQDPHRPEIEDLAPYFHAEPTRSAKRRTEAMAAARRAARQRQDHAPEPLDGRSADDPETLAG